MEIEDNLDALLELEREHDEIDKMDYPEELDRLENAVSPSIEEQTHSKEDEMDPEIVELLNETVDVNENEDEIDNHDLDEDEHKEQYIYTVPPEGKSMLCKLGDGSMVFLKRSSIWNKQNCSTSKAQLLSKPIESLIDEVRENAIRKEAIRRELADSSSKRSHQANWETSFQPRSFIDLISDEFSNRVFLKWLSQWKPMLFHTHENISTADIDALPFFCPTCGKGGFHANSCTKKQPLRPYYTPDLPSPLPTRPANPLFVLSGPTGCGKTTLIQIAASAHNLRLISFGGEMMGVSLEQTLQEIKNLFDNKALAFGSSLPPLLLFDNFDSSFSIHERKAIVSLLLRKYKEVGQDSSKLLFPVVICCNDMYGCNIYELRSFYQQMKLPQIADSQQLQLLQRICVKQGIPYELNGLSAIVASSGGDIRFTLNTMQSLVLSQGTVTVKAVKSALLNSKDVVQSMDDYYNLMFICRRSHGKSRESVSNLSSIFTHFYDINQDRVVDGMLEYIPTIPLPDPGLQHYGSAMDALCQYDSISRVVRALKHYTLQSVLPAYLGYIHSLYRREKPAKIKHVSSKAGYLVYQRIQNNKTQLIPLKESKALRESEGCRSLPLIMEYLCPLFQVITPTMRPVDTLLLTSKEKQELARITNTMIEYGMTYESSQSTGRLMIALKPDIEALAIYPDIPSPFSKVLNAVKFKVQTEIQKRVIQNENSIERTPKKKLSSEQQQTPKKKRPSSSFFESPKKKLQMDVTVDEKQLEKQMTPIKKTTFFNSQQTSRTRKVVKGVVFRYQKGFTCAVRQAATVHDFL